MGEEEEDPEITYLTLLLQEALVARARKRLGQILLTGLLTIASQHLLALIQNFTSAVSPQREVLLSFFSPSETGFDVFCL